MAIKERKQITGTEAQIKGYAGHNGVLAYATDTKHLHVLSGTAGTTTKLANMSDIPAPVDVSGKADKTYVDTELAKKQAKGDYATNTALTQGLAGKANVTDLNVTISNALKPYATTNTVNTELAKKANASHTHTVSQITDMPNVVLSVNDITPDDSGNVKVGALPLGHLFAWPFQTPPDGAIQCNGASYNRALYKDLFAYATSEGWVKTEAEWQEIATRDNGFCPFYSDGDGSTNFRTPKFAPYQQIAITSASVGKYHQAGLPNITGSVSVSGGENDLSRTSGTFVSSGALTASSTTTTTWAGYENVSGRYWNKLSISASNSNKTYGRSSTVQPESHEWVVCVVAYGVATNVGSVDIQNVMSAVNAVQAKVEDKLGVSTVHIIGTWKSTNGNSWYRKWSDGFIEQGGKIPNGNAWEWYTATLNTPFTTTSYTLVVGVYVTDGSSAPEQQDNDYFLGKKSANSFSYRQLGDIANPTADWYACGY